VTAVVPGLAPALAEPAPPPAGRPRPLRTLLRRPSFTVPALILVFWLGLALGWEAFGLEPYARTGALLSGPSAGHPLGTDSLGRDVFARVAAGARPALVIGLLGSALATTLGGGLGLLAGYFRGWVDLILMRVFDVLLALPALILLVVLVGAFGVSTPALVAVVALVFAPGIARIVRASVLVETGKTYLTTARLQGESHRRLITRELLPNVLPAIVIQAVLSIGAAIFISASLSFLGLGSQPPSADWGLAINENRVFLQTAWWTVTFPALGVASVVVSANLIADNLREVLE
jgi:peptide/nickel transport system permease protein